MADQSIPPGTGEAPYVNPLIAVSAGQPADPKPKKADPTYVNPLIEYSQRSPLDQMADQVHMSSADLDPKIAANRDIQNRQAAFDTTAKLGYYLGENGEKISTDGLDQASLFDRILGNTVDGTHLARKTTGYASDSLDWLSESKDSITSDRQLMDGTLGFIPGAQKLLGDLYNQDKLKVYEDADGNHILKKFTPQNQEDYSKVQSAYGPKTFSQNFVSSFAQGLGDLIGNTPSGAVRLAQLGKDMIDPAQDSFIDTLSKHMSDQESANGAATTADQNNLGTLDGFAHSIGSGISSLVAFSGYGKAVSWLAKTSMLFSGSGIELAGRLGGAFLLSAGSAYDEAIESGLDRRSAGAMALATGAVDAFLQEKIGSNVLAKWLVGGGHEALAKIQLEEIKKLGGEVTEKTLNAASGNIIKRAINAAGIYFDKVTEIPVVGEGVDQGVQMGIQSLVNSTGKMFYNMGHQKDPTLTEGKGLYQHQSDSQMFAQAFTEAGSSAILGMLMGAAHYQPKNKQEEEKSIIPAIVQGKTADLKRALDWLRSDGHITPEQAQAYGQRIDQLDDIFHKNRKAFEGIKDPYQRQETINKAISAIDQELIAKNRVKQEQDVLTGLMGKGDQENVSETTHKDELDKQQEKVKIEQEGLTKVQQKIKDFIPDEDGRVPFHQHQKMRDIFHQELIDKYLDKNPDTDGYSKGFMSSFTKSLGAPFEHIIRDTYDLKKPIDDHFQDLHNLVAPHVPELNGKFASYIAHQKEQERLGAMSLKDRVTGLDNQALGEMGQNEQFSKGDQAIIQDEINKRKNEAETKQPPADGSYDYTDEGNIAKLKAIVAHPDFLKNIQNHQAFPVKNIKAYLQHDESVLPDDARDAFLEELKRRVNNPVTPKADAPVIPIQPGNPLPATEGGNQESSQAADPAAEPGSFDPAINPFAGVKEFEGVAVTGQNEPTPQLNPGTDPYTLTFDDLLNGEADENERTRTSAHFVAYNSKAHDKENHNLYEPGTGLLQEAPHNQQLELPGYAMPGEEVHLRRTTYAEAVANHYSLSEKEFDKASSDPATLPIVIVGADDKIWGFYPTQKNIDSTQKVKEEEKALGRNNRLKLFNDTEGTTKLYTRNLAKLPGYLNIIDRAKGFFQSYPIFNMLGNKGLAPGVHLSIIQQGQAMLGKGVPDNTAYVNNSTPEGYVVASIPRADGSHVAVPLKIAKVDLPHAIATMKLLQALFSKQDKSGNYSKLRQALDKELTHVNLESEYEIMKAIKSIIYVQEHDKLASPENPIPTKDAQSKASVNNIFYIDRTQPKDIRVVLGETSDLSFKVNELFPTTGGERNELFLKTLQDRYRSVNLENLNDPNEFRSFSHVQEEGANGQIVAKTHDNYLQYLNDDGVLTTDLQGFPVQGSDRYTFTSQPVIQLDGHTYEKSAEGVATARLDEPEMVGTKEELPTVKAVYGKSEAELIRDLPEEDDLYSLGPQVVSEDQATDQDYEGNINTEDKLFVDINEFKVVQQDAVVKSLAATIYRLAESGITRKNELMAGAKDSFMLYMKSIENSADSKLVNLTKLYRKIFSEEYYPKFEAFALAHLEKLGTSFKKGELEFTEAGEAPQVEELDGQTDGGISELDRASQTNERTQMDDNYQFSTSQLNKASSRLKSLLSFIPASVHVPDEARAGFNILKEKTNSIGQSEFMSLSGIWNKLMQVAEGLKPGQLLPEMKNLAKNDPVFDAILDKISKSDDTIKREFQVLLSKQQARFFTTLMGTRNAAGFQNHKVINTNSTGAADTVLAAWQEGLKATQQKENGLVKVDKDHNIYIDTATGKDIKARYEAAIKDLDINNAKKKNPGDKLKALMVLRDTLREIGFPVTDRFINHIDANGMTLLGARNLDTILKTKIPENLLKTLAGNATKVLGQDGNADTSLFDAHNPFLREQSTLKALANVEAAANTQLYEPSFVGGDGKARYGFVNHSYLSSFMDQMVKLDSTQKGNYLNDLKDLPYTQDSMWLKNWELMKGKFKLGYFDTLKDQGGKGLGKLIKDMSNAEKDLVRAQLYQNAGNEMSQYLLPVVGDKTLWPMIQAMRQDVTFKEVDGKYVLNSGTPVMTDLYNVYLSEQKRIKQVQKVIAERKTFMEANPDSTVHSNQLMGYHYLKAEGDRKGMGEKFLGYQFMNEKIQNEHGDWVLDPKIWNEDGSIREPDRAHIEGRIKDFFNDAIKDQEKSWIENKLVDPKNVGGSLLFDSQAAKSRLKKLDGKEDRLIKSFAAEYTVNQFLFHHNYQQLIGGDPALHGKKTVKETLINYNKRMVKDMAPGLDPIFDKPRFRALFLKDILGASQFKEQYIKILSSTIGEEAARKAFDENEITNAQEYTTLDEHLSVMHGLGQDTKSVRDAVKRLKEGGSDPQDISAILNPNKPVYVGDKIDKNLGVAIKYYFKTSSFPLIPALVRESPGLNSLRLFMENHPGGPIDRAIYESGIKLGQESSGVLMNDEGSTAMNPHLDENTRVYDLDRKGFRIQQDIPFHGYSHATEGTQARVHINANLDPEQQIHALGQTRTAKDAIALFEGLHAQKLALQWQGLKKTFGIDRSEGKIRIKDLPAFRKILMDEAIKRDFAPNEIAGLNLVKNNLTGEYSFKVPLAYNSASSKFEAIMNSLFTNRVLKLDLPGNTSVQASSAGFEHQGPFDHMKDSELSAQQKSDIIWVDPATAGQPLEYYHTKDGKNIVAEIMLPSFFKDGEGNNIDLRTLLNEKGQLDMTKVDPKLLELFGYRIPTQGLNSMMTFKVKGFLPSYMGDMTVVPKDITTVMGSDFDVDKLFLHHFNYNYEGGKFTSLAPLREEELQDLKRVNDPKRLENGILQYYMDRYHHADEDTHKQILELNGYGKLEELNKEITGLLDKGTKNLATDNFLLAKTQNDFHRRNVDGLAGKGIFSLYSIFMQRAIANRMKLQAPITFNIDGQAVARKHFEVKNVNDQYCSSVISYLQSASVDNAKLQYLSGLNINPHTMGVAGTIAAAGFDESHIAYFLSQPIIRGYVESQLGLKDVTADKYVQNKEEKAINDLVQPYIIQSGNEYGDNYYQKVMNKNMTPRDTYSLDDMKGQLVLPEAAVQIDMLTQFLRIKQQSRQIDEFNQSTSIHKGVGASYLELRDKVEAAIKNRELKLDAHGHETSSPQPINKLFGKHRAYDESSIVGKTTDLAIQFHDAIKEFFPYDSEAYRSIVEEVKKHSNLDGEQNVDWHKKLYGQINSFVLSDHNLIDGEDVNHMRERLLFDTKTNKSLLTRLIEAKNTPGGQRNELLQRLQLLRPTNTGDVAQVNAINIPSAVKGDNIQEALQGFYKLNKDPATHELSVDLMKYFMTTGGSFNPTSIARYIPADLLEEYDYSAKLRKTMGDAMVDASLFSRFVPQYFQHNIDKTFKIPQSEFGNKGGVKQEDNYTRILVPRTNSRLKFVDSVDEKGQDAKAFPGYLSRYDRNTQTNQLFVLSHTDALDGTHTYSRVNALGKANFSEFNYQSQESGVTPSNILKNRIANGYIGPVLAGIPMNAEYYEQFKPAPEVITHQQLTDKLGFKDGKANAREVIDRILADTATKSIKRLQTVAREIRELIGPDEIIVQDNSSDAGGWYNATDHSIHLNLDRIMQTDHPTKETMITAVHELLHSVTKRYLDDPSLLTTDEQRRAHKNIHTLFNEYVRKSRSEDKTGLDYFRSISSRITENNNAMRHHLDKLHTITKDDEQFFNKNLSKYYPLTNIHEFVAGLTDPSFAQKLSTDSVWQKLGNAVMNLLGIKYKSDFAFLLKNVLDMRGKEAGFDFGWDAASKIVGKMDQPVTAAPQEPENSNPFGNVTAQEGDTDPNDDGQIPYYSGKQRSLDAAEIARQKILHRYNGNNQGFMPKEVMGAAVQQEISRYNQAAGYEALVLKRAKNDSLYIVKGSGNTTTLYATGPIGGKDTRSALDKTTDDLIAALKNKNLLLKDREKNSPNKINVGAMIGFNNKQIKKLQEVKNVTGVVNIASTHIDHVYAKLKSGKVNDINELNELSQITDIFATLPATISRESIHLLDNDTNKKVSDMTAYINKIQQMIMEQKNILAEETVRMNTDILPESDVQDVFNGIQIEPSVFRQQFLVGSKSENMLIRTTANLITAAKTHITSEFNKWSHHSMDLFANYYKAGNKDFTPLLQLGKNGKPNGRLLSEVGAAYGEALHEAYQNKKEWEFVRDNNTFEVPKEGRDHYNRDLNRLKATHPNWDDPTSLDYDKYQGFVRRSDPYAYIEAIKDGVKPVGDYARAYLTQTAHAKWHDPRYFELMNKGADTPEVALYTHLRDEFKAMNTKYNSGRSANMIPELGMSTMGYLYHGNFAGAFNHMKSDFLNSFTSSVDPIMKHGQLDIKTGRPYDTIPIPFLQNRLNPADRSYDLKKVLMTSKLQDISFNHKQKMEPYLLHMNQLMQEGKSNIIDNSGSPRMMEDENGDAKTIVQRNTGLDRGKAQMQFMLDDFLYDKAVHTYGVNAPKDGENTALDGNRESGMDGEQWRVKGGPPRYLTFSKMTDSLNTLTRSTGLIMNVPAAINNITFGFMSNLNYAFGGGKDLDMGTCWKANGVILSAMVPGSPQAHKIKLFMEKFNVQQLINEISHGKVEGKDLDNPLAQTPFRSAYWMSEDGEYLIQGALAIGMALHTTSGTSNAYEGYKVDGNKLVWDDTKGPNPFPTEQDEHLFAARIKKAIDQNHGNYTERIMVKQEWYGRLLMTFKTWIPELVNSHFGKEVIGLDGSVEKGRYVSLLALAGEKGQKSAQNFVTNLTVALFKDPSLSTLRPVDRINVRRAVSEAVTTAALFSFALALKAGMQGEKDKDKKENMIFLMNMANRNVQDMSFFWNPKSAIQLTGNLFPAMTTLKNLYAILPTMADAVMGNDTQTKGVYKDQSKLKRAIIKVVPILNAGQKIETMTRQTFTNN